MREGFEKNAGKSGQVLAITYAPGKRTSVEVQGAKAAETVTVEGKDFADALFSVWLGKHPVDDDLKEEMLRNR